MGSAHGVPPGGITDGTSGPIAVTVTPGASNTKGVYAQVTAALAYEAHGVWIWATSATHLGAANNSWLLDIATGAAAAETVVIPNVLAGAKETGTLVAFPLLGYFPIRIPKGSRVAARLQANAAVPSPATAEFRFMFVRESQLGVFPHTKLLDLGAQTANGRGQDLAVLGATNTKGAWTTITASCPQALQGVVVSVQGGTDTAFASAWGVLDVGVGPAASEVVRLGDLPLRFNANEAVAMLWPGFYPMNVRAGDRIAVRYACSSTANDLDVNLTGVPA